MTRVYIILYTEIPILYQRSTVLRKAMHTKSADCKIQPAQNILTIRLLYHISHFGCKIVLTLLKTFALLETNELSDLDRTAESLGSFVGISGNILAVVLNKLLIYKAVLLIELSNLTLNDLRENLLGLVSHLRILLHLSDHDLLLMLDNLSRNITLIKVLSVESCDLHCNVLAVSNERRIGSVDIGFKVYENADLSACMNISNASTLISYKTSDLDILTDNRNRTAADVRHLFSRFGGNLGETGCVGWMFKQKAVFVVEKETFGDEDALMDIVLEAGAEDMRSEDDVFEITAEPADFDAIEAALGEKGIETASAEITMVPDNTVKVEGKDAEKLQNLVDALEENDDVQNVYGNYEMDEEE